MRPASCLDSFSSKCGEHRHPIVRARRVSQFSQSQSQNPQLSFKSSLLLLKHPRLVVHQAVQAREHSIGANPRTSAENGELTSCVHMFTSPKARMHTWQKATAEQVSNLLDSSYEVVTVVREVKVRRKKMETLASQLLSKRGALSIRGRLWAFISVIVQKTLKESAQSPLWLY
jgi:hypothetical protein